jgi:hypothetical protein
MVFPEKTRRRSCDKWAVGPPIHVDLDVFEFGFPRGITIRDCWGYRAQFIE